MSNEGCPVDAATRHWVDARASWILDQFGRDRVRSCEIILPTAEFIPVDSGRDETSARALLERICGYLHLNPHDIELVLYREHQRPGDGNRPLGVYEQLQGGYRVWVEESSHHEPLDLAATMAHELCHVHLIGHGRLTADEDDHEPLTDLLTVFLGLGIITSNSALNERYWRSGAGWDGNWEVSRRGYLTMPIYGYALALFSMLRDETSPAWRNYLHPGVREALQSSIKFLGEHGVPDLRSVLKRMPVQRGCNPTQQMKSPNSRPRPPSARSAESNCHTADSVMS